ncbi:conserved Plasmodium protein, unknown function [Plasmodium ovale curtisi]|uniref:WW domain-containing protein n=1 Tax=Plasmodium ovale curtisi TaxID=864141 RepID=A0A1A8WEX6_PLAOA|nr:conserved Plasmodium protein, unknown function [Plasmodium ovale curtisi]
MGIPKRAAKAEGDATNGGKEVTNGEEDATNGRKEVTTEEEDATNGRKEVTNGEDDTAKRGKEVTNGEDDATKKGGAAGKYLPEGKMVGNKDDNIIHNGSPVHISAPLVDRKRGEMVSKETQERLVGVPHSWEYVEDSKGWFIIETSKNYIFYFNKKTKEKTWKRPQEVEELLKGKIIKSEERVGCYDDENDHAYRDNRTDLSGNDGTATTKNEASSRSDDRIETALKEYKNLLREKKITVFCKYEKVLSNILYDKRYQNVPKEMRKEYFYKLVKEINEDKKIELKKLMENFENFLKKEEKKFIYPFKESDAVIILKGKMEYEGNFTQSWEKTRNKLLKNFLLKKKEKIKIKAEEEFEKNLCNCLKDEHPGLWFKIKKNLMKEKKYDILSYEKKNQLFDMVSKKLLDNKRNDLKKKKKKEHGKYDQVFEQSYDKEYNKDNIQYVGILQHKIGKREYLFNDKNSFLGILHEKLKYPIIKEDFFLKYNRSSSPFEKENINFEKMCSLPSDILNDDRYKKLHLNDKEKFIIYKEFLNSYIKMKQDTFHKLLSSLSINCINKSLGDIIKMVDHNNKIFKVIMHEHLEDVYTKWKNYHIREAKKVFSDFLIKSNFIKHDSDTSANYPQLIRALSCDIR